VLNVAPDVDGGAFPAKSVVDEEFDVTATVFREGHDAVNATVVLTDPDGAETHVPMTLVSAGLDHWSATVSAPRTGMWSYRV
jgi:starch synthase (maltosyl-transferring)